MIMNKRVWWNTFATIDLKYATIKIKDGTSVTPKELEIKVGEGNLTYTERKEMIYDKDRNALDTVREGEEQPVELNFDIKWTYITALAASGTPTVEDALKKKGEASTWVSTDEDECAPYCVDIEIEYVPDCQATGNTEIISFPDFRYEELAHDLRNATIACSGRCNATEAGVARS